jgi:hypothetical protein
MAAAAKVGGNRPVAMVTTVTEEATAAEEAVASECASI